VASNASLFAGAEIDVAEMAEAGAQMPDLYICVGLLVALDPVITPPESGCKRLESLSDVQLALLDAGGWLLSAARGRQS